MEVIMAGTSEGGKKAAITRGYESLSAAGRKGGKNSHSNQYTSRKKALQQQQEENNNHASANAHSLATEEQDKT